MGPYCREAKVNAKDDSGRTALDMVPRFSPDDLVMPAFYDAVEANKSLQK